MGTTKNNRQSGFSIYEKKSPSSVQLLEQDFGASLSLEKVYRMMNQLDDNTIDRLQSMTCQGTRFLLSGTLDGLFFDCTTLYFESFKEDELKQNGYSKDCKFNQPQVLLALLVTHEGLPVGYEVFPGATFEGHSLITVLKDMQARYDVGKMIMEDLSDRECEQCLRENTADNCSCIICTSAFHGGRMPVLHRYMDVT